MENSIVRVSFIDCSTGETFGATEITADRLPETFEVATTLHLADVDWEVVEATPAKAEDFIRTGQLVLKLKKVEYMNPQDILYSLPTISNELAGTTSQPLYSDFVVSIHSDSWRQNELLNKSLLPVVLDELAEVKEVWTNHSQQGEEFSVFDKIHVRMKVGNPSLAIPFDELCKQLKPQAGVGALQLEDYEGFVENTFVIRTSHSTYYGVLLDGMVKEFAAVSVNENTLQELEPICSAYKLLFVQWCNVDVHFA